MKGFVELFNVFSVVVEYSDNMIVTYYPAKVKLVNNKLFMLVSGHLVRIELENLKNLKFNFNDKVQ